MVADGPADRKQQYDLLLNAAVEARDARTGIVGKRDIMQGLGMDPNDPDADNAYLNMASFLDGKDLIERYAGYDMILITPKGMDYVDEELQQQQSHTTNMQFYGSLTAYGSAVGGQQNAEINFSFDMGAAQDQLDRAKAEADRRAGPDAEQIKELLAELEEHLYSNEPIRAGMLARFQEVAQRNAYVIGPVISTLLNIAFTAAA
ncbi:MAG: hypothetical protein M3305_08315 [Actinomycetota bacterium]|nr:hypothetical protein [Actinomycetota bacterium]